ncbi:MAG TPA: amino acid-binding protein [Planctomycetota bacterium]|nr:amino acid-binding protein [Planctomycetota bacterium]HRR81858.1 amino acid-binding protein [Planctomycetota bacterium]HRT93600.1 amino acid-binding protein [Planctomycetota bacterium]
MALKVSRVDTWAASIVDQPGGLAAKLKALAAAGANLEMVIARRAPEKPGTGVVFVTPIKGAKQAKAAKAAGFAKSKSLHTVRVQGPDKKGMGARMAEAIAAAGVNLRGLSAAAIGKAFVAHVAVDKASDAAKVARALKAL